LYYTFRSLPCRSPPRSTLFPYTTLFRSMEEPQLSSAQVSVESVLLRTLAHLRRSQDFLEQLHGAGGVAELYVTLFAREDFRLELSAQSLALLGRLGLAVALDVHPQPSHGLSQRQAS